MILLIFYKLLKKLRLIDWILISVIYLNIWLYLLSYFLNVHSILYRWVWAIIICKRVLDTRNSLEIPKEDRHYNDQMKKNKMTNNDLQNTKAKQLNPSPSFLCESTVILNSSSCIIYLQFCWLNLLVLWFVHSIMPLYVDQMGPLMATSVHSNPLNACKFYLLLTNIFFSAKSR